MNEPGEVEQWLRRRVLGLLHAGRLKPGERLPSIRQVSGSTGADHRVVADAYRVLERDGLVTIRPGSGVYLAYPGQSGGAVSESIRWMSGLLLDGWERGLPRAEVGEVVRRSTETRPRCACLESNEDHMVAVCAELEDDFGLEPVPLRVDPTTEARDIPPGNLARVDLVVTTVFHADLARAAALRAGKPFVVLTLHPDFSTEVDRVLQEPSVTVVYVDPRYEDRARVFLAVTPYLDRIRFVPVDRVGDLPLDLARPHVLLTRAARRRLGMDDFHLVPPPPPVVSSESARELFDVIVRLALQNEPG
ncbi:MAG TPA: GntR family transcriptional regulator [Longimicrobium sp.]|jgi:DNA-binding transcriptional regulator YhcF (GntR family)